MDLTEKTLTETTQYRGRIFTVKSFEVALPDGRTAVRDIVVNPDAAAVVALDGDNRVLLVRQFRRSANRVLLEIPAGKLDPGETPCQAARRELMEETGHTAAHWRFLCAGRVSPGFATEVIHIYLATGLSPATARPDDDEFLEPETVPLADMADRVMAGGVDDMKTVAGILAAARVLGL